MIQGTRVLKGMYELLKSLYPQNVKEFEKNILVPVVEIDDLHRKVTGYMLHRDAIVIKKGEKTFVLSYGKATGADIVNLYLGGRIVLFESKHDNVEKELNERTRYFSNTLLIGLYDGRIITAGETMEKKADRESIDEIKKTISKYNKELPLYDKNYIDVSTMRYAIKKEAEYDNELVEELSKKVSKIIEKL